MTLLERQLAASVLEVQQRKQTDDAQSWIDLTPVPPKRLRRKKMTQAIERVEPQQLAKTVPTDGFQDFLAMREQAKVLVQSGFLPKAVNTPEKAMAIIQTGRELGLGPMQSLRSIHIIEGKPTMSADLIAGLALAKVPGSVLRVAETTNEKCVVEAGRAGQKVTPFTFTMKDAQQAGLAGKSNWKNYPRAMLRARAITEAARAIFPDAVMGLYDPDELGAVTNEGGQVIELPRDNGAPIISQHVFPGESHDDPPKDSEEFGAVCTILNNLEEEIARTKTVTWDDVCRWRDLLGAKGKPSEFGKRVEALYQGDDVSPGMRQAMMSQVQRVNRQVKRYEGIVPAPGPEASFGDEEDEREPGEEG